METVWYCYDCVTVIIAKDEQLCSSCGNTTHSIGWQEKTPPTTPPHPQGPAVKDKNNHNDLT